MRWVLQKALGMVLITHGKTLQGIFTDGDLRRVLETLALNSNSLEGQQNIQDITIGAVMTKNCKSISADKPAMAAVVRTRFKEITHWEKIGFC
jgi:arabinose-5-phosphate isomerase